MNKELDYILFSEGRIVNNEGDFAFEYHLRDHLGSVRVAFVPEENEKTVTQINAYYPFGAPIADLSFSNSDNKYLREGKEYIDDFDWNKYDFHARTFDSWNPRSLQIDPLAEKYYNISPYALWGNNPLRYVDPTGKSPEEIEEEPNEDDQEPPPQNTSQQSVTTTIENKQPLVPENVLGGLSVYASQTEGEAKTNNTDIKTSTDVSNPSASSIIIENQFGVHVSDVPIFGVAHHQGGNDNSIQIGASVTVLGVTQGISLELSSDIINSSITRSTGFSGKKNSSGIEYSVKPIGLALTAAAIVVVVYGAPIAAIIATATSLAPAFAR